MEKKLKRTAICEQFLYRVTLTLSIQQWLLTWGAGPLEGIGHPE